MKQAVFAAGRTFHSITYQLHLVLCDLAVEWDSHQPRCKGKGEAMFEIQFKDPSPIVESRKIPKKGCSDTEGASKLQCCFGPIKALPQDLRFKWYRSEVVSGN